jgi:hypothetical protein
VQFTTRSARIVVAALVPRARQVTFTCRPTGSVHVAVAAHVPQKSLALVRSQTLPQERGDPSDGGDRLTPVDTAEFRVLGERAHLAHEAPQRNRSLMQQSTAPALVICMRTIRLRGGHQPWRDMA